MNKKMKQHLTAVVTALVNEDTAACKESFHQYMGMKTQAVLLGEKAKDDNDEAVDKDLDAIDKDLEEVKKDEKKEKKDFDKAVKDTKKAKKDQKKDEDEDICSECKCEPCECDM